MLLAGGAAVGLAGAGLLELVARGGPKKVLDDHIGYIAEREKFIGYIAITGADVGTS